MNVEKIKPVLAYVYLAAIIIISFAIFLQASAPG